MKMELIEGSETSAYINQTPGNYPKGNLLYSVHGESLKSRIHPPSSLGNKTRERGDNYPKIISRNGFFLKQETDEYSRHALILPDLMSTLRNILYLSECVIDCATP